MGWTRILLVIALTSLLAGCLPGKPEVVVYTSLDEMYSQPILDDFTASTGILVKAVYDTEAAKTTGLVTRLIEEKDRPRADVFWNNEVVQTIVLKGKGVLQAHPSQAAKPFPDHFKDPQGFWTGFAARGRVIIYNTNLVTTPPTSIQAFLDPQWKGKAAMARPIFGTTATEAATLFALWGEEKARAFFEGIKTNGVAVLAGNASVRDAVARGDYAFGWTDTDDANGAVEDGLPVKWLFPDQDGIGTLIIPNTVSMVAGAPHPEAGRELIDYLLSPAVEAKLANLRSLQIPLNPNVQTPERVPKLSGVKTIDLPFEAAADQMEHAMTVLREVFSS